jgi:hypothetical protein
MENKSSNLIFLTGIIGILGTIIMIISDIILLGHPTSGSKFTETGLNNLNDLLDVSKWRLTIGSFLSVLGHPLQIIGAYQVFIGLKPGGKWRSLPVFLILTHSIIIGCAFHISHAYIGAGLQAEYNAGSAAIYFYQMVEAFYKYNSIFCIILPIGVVVSSLLFTVAVLSNKTAYPRWMAIFNPLILITVIMFIFKTIPAPMGGYLSPTYANLGILIFFIISTTILHRKNIAA